MAEMLSFPFMQRAILAGVLVGILASYYGVFVVQRGLSFLGSGLAHAAFGGVAIGLVLSLQPLLVAVPYTVLIAIGIVYLREKTQLGGDTAIGILFSISMALGIILLSWRTGFSSDAFTYLFGSILAVTPADLWITAAVLAATAMLLPLWSRWAYATFDRELAAADRVPILRHDYILATLLAITVVVAVKLVGAVLIAAFLVIPAAAARLIARTFASMTSISMAIGVSSSIAGLFASYLFDVATGPAIILVQAVIFAVTALLNRDG